MLSRSAILYAGRSQLVRACLSRRRGSGLREIGLAGFSLVLIARAQTFPAAFSLPWCEAVPQDCVVSVPRLSVRVILLLARSQCIQRVTRATLPPGDGVQAAGTLRVAAMQSQNHRWLSFLLGVLGQVEGRRGEWGKVPWADRHLNSDR